MEFRFERIRVPAGGRVVNPNRQVRGVDKIVGGMLAAVPDVDEFLRDVECIEAYIEKDLNDLRTAREAVRMAERSLCANVRLLAERVQDGRREWRSYKDEFEAGAADVGMVVPQLGFSVVVPLHRENGGSVA